MNALNTPAATRVEVSPAENALEVGQRVFGRDMFRKAFERFHHSTEPLSEPFASISGAEGDQRIHQAITGDRKLEMLRHECMEAISSYGIEPYPGFDFAYELLMELSDEGMSFHESDFDHERARELFLKWSIDLGLWKPREGRELTDAQNFIGKKLARWKFLWAYAFTPHRRSGGLSESRDGEVNYLTEGGTEVITKYENILRRDLKLDQPPVNFVQEQVRQHRADVQEMDAIDDLNLSFCPAINPSSHFDLYNPFGIRRYIVDRLAHLNLPIKTPEQEFLNS